MCFALNKIESLDLWYPPSELTRCQGTKPIAQAIYKCESLPVVTETYQTFNGQLNTQRATNESFKNYEFRFSDQVVRL